MKKLLLGIVLALFICVIAQNVFANDDHHGDHHKQPVQSDVAMNHDHDHDGHDHCHKDHGHDH